MQVLKAILGSPVTNGCETHLSIWNRGFLWADLDTSWDRVYRSNTGLTKRSLVGSYPARCLIVPLGSSAEHQWKTSIVRMSRSRLVAIETDMLSFRYR